MTNLEVKGILINGYNNIKGGSDADAGAIDVLGSEDKEVSRSFINHLNKLLSFLAPERIKNEKSTAKEAVKQFIKIAIDRDNHGVRNAYVSFTRPRKQILCKDKEGNESQERRGRPNLYRYECYRSITNRRKK